VIEECLAEQAYDLGNTSGEFPESGNYWLANGPKGGGLREAYLRGDIGIAWRRTETGADWEAPKRGFLLKVNRLAPNALESRKSRYPRGGNTGLHRNEPLVLSQDIELVQGPQKRISSLVWPECFDRRLLALGKPLFAFNTLQGVDHVLLRSEDWKVRFLTRFYAVACGESGSEEIEGAADGIDDHAGVGANERINGAVLASYQQLVSGVRIWLYDEFVWARPLPGEEALLQDWDLGYGPIDGSLGV